MNPDQLSSAEAWNLYAAETLPPEAPQQQRDAMRMSFLAGAVTVVKLYLALKQHAPTGVDAGLSRFMTGAVSELQMLGADTPG